MTHTEYTKLILNIEDENIHFYDNCLEIKEIKGIKTKIFHPFLTYTPTYCPKCNHKCDSHEDIIKWNFKRNCKIKINKACNYNTLLLLDKQRFYCKHCKKTFIASTNIVDFHKQISNDTRKVVTMDLYKPYYTLMHKLFNNAILIPDRYHIVLQIRNALDKTRINLCKKTNPNYKKLKKYWKLILKKENELEKNNKYYSKNFKKEMSQHKIVQYLINTDETFKNVYNLYQGIIKSIDERDKEKFIKIIHNIDYKKLNKHTITAIKTYINLEKYIINAFDYELSNGIVEGTNNLIKQVKHNACGYRKFSHLKARIMLIKGIYNPLKA